MSSAPAQLYGFASEFARKIYANKYSQSLPNGEKEDWPDTAERVVSHVMGPYMPHMVEEVRQMVVQRWFIPGGRYLYAAGRRYAQVNNCFLFRAADSRDGPCGWGETMNKTTQSLMTGGGIGVVYSDLRPGGAPIRGMGGKSTGPLALMNMVNEAGRHIVQGGSRRSAIWAGLHWWHPDIFNFMGMKNWSEDVKRLKETDFNFPAMMDGTNISVILDTAFRGAYNTPGWRRTYRLADVTYEVDHDWARRVYWTAVRGMVCTGEPGFSIDMEDNEGENLRNACTEVTSEDDGDMCNLGSLNLARIPTLEDFRRAVRAGIAFLLCGTLYSRLPLEYMHRVREKTRRLGLGLMGVHEWLLRRGKRYEPDDQLGTWLASYAQSGAHADHFCDQLQITRCKATRAIAPNGTIGIVGETTTSAEPIPAVAYKRRYRDGANCDVHKYQYVIDPTAKRLIDSGVKPELIEDSVTLAEDVERRIKFQAWLQGYVDHGISSTINLPPWGTKFNSEETLPDFGNTLMKYIPKLRGITAYPDGARGGQPITRVPYEEAIGQEGVEFTESEERCNGRVCGS